MRIIYQYVAGLDVHKKTTVAAIIVQKASGGWLQEKRTFGTMTTDLLALSDWLMNYGDQVWVSDITCIRLRDEFAYLAVIMDVFTRSIRGWHLGRSLDQSLTLIALDRALAGHRPEIHHSDQGIQYAAPAYTLMLRAVDAKISMAEIGEAWHAKRGYAERLVRTIKEEEVDLSDYECYNDAVFQLGRFLNDVYMHKRIHSSLGYLTPAEFEERWRCEREQPLDVH
jgi:putative transposase